MEAVLCFVALSTLLYIWFLKLAAAGRSNSSRKPQLPPGPWTLPIIGSLHHVISTLPHRTITDLCRRHGPLMLLKLGELPAVVISSAEAVAQVMKTNDAAFLNRRTTGLQDIVGFGGQGIIFAPYGDHWRQMRKVCVMELLSPKQVRRMEGIRAEQVGGLVRSIASSAGAATINVSQEVAALSNGIVTHAVFGGNFVRQEEYLRQVDEIMDLMGGFCLVDLFPSSWLVRWLSNGERRMKRSCASILRIIADIIDKRKAMRAAGSNEDEDLLDVLLRLQHEDSLAFPLTTEMIATVLFDMFGAATETTGTTLEWAMSELITHPEVMVKAQFEVRKVIDQDQATISNSDLAELPYLRMVIKEVLRLHPPTPLLPRKTREDCKIMGFDILKETNIYINIFAISRDPQYWDNPTNFNPERFENKNVDYNGSCFEFTPFGGGRRQCPGITFASSILEITLANFLYHFDWMLPDEASLLSLDMSEKFGFSVRRRTDLQLRAIPRTYSKATPI